MFKQIFTALILLVLSVPIPQVLLASEASLALELGFPLQNLEKITLSVKEKEILASKGMLYSASPLTMYRLMSSKLQNFEYLNFNFYEFKDCFDECFDFKHPSMEEYLAFISERIGEENVAVRRIEEFLQNPRFFLERQTRTIFLYQNSTPGDPHITAIVLFPGKYIEVIDSLRKCKSVYPARLVEEIYRIIASFNKSCLPKDQHMMLIEHDVARQTTGGVCAYFAIFSALQAQYHPAWYKLLASEGDRVVLPMDAKLMSATGSLNRLTFLESLGQYLFRWHNKDPRGFAYASLGIPQEKKLPNFDFKHVYRGALSPITTETKFFQIMYMEEVEQWLSTSRDLAEVSLNLEGHSPMSLASPYILMSPVRKLINTMVTAMKLEFDLWRAYKKL